MDASVGKTAGVIVPALLVFFVLPGCAETQDATVYYPVVDTGQVACYGNIGQIPAPGPNEPFYGQDAQHAGVPPAYRDNGDGTVTDRATGLMWSQADSGAGMNWQAALDWVQQKNRVHYLGHSDRRLPDAKELQSIVDYTRSPKTTNSAAIDPNFSVTPITDEGGGTNYPFYWTSTTHAGGIVTGSYAVYVAFGEAPGFMESPPGSGLYQLMDVHGAGAQRSDPKVGDAADWPCGHGPQGDVIRINNFVRPVRGVSVTALSGSEP
jgi:hypothetical protein